MAKLSLLHLEDGTVIYIETTVEITTTTDRSELPPEEVRRTMKGITFSEPLPPIAQNFQAIEGTIRAYTIHAFNDFCHLIALVVDDQFPIIV